MANLANYGLSDSPATIGPEGVPECRMSDAQTTQDFVQRLVQNDYDRAFKRGLVDGLVDMNPPYKGRALRDAGRADACNVNWGTAAALWGSSAGALFDLITQAPGRVSISLEYGNNDEKRREWERIMTSVADETFSAEHSWITRMQLSQKDTVLHGKGPFYFESPHHVFPRQIPTANLLLPDRSPIHPNEWEICAVTQEYYPPKLYEFIRKRESAEALGWDVDFVWSVIKNAVQQKMPDSNRQTEEWWQNEMKTNSYNYVDSVLVCRVAHVFWREFPDENSPGPGRVTHAIVETQPSADKGAKYLFLSVGRYAEFDQAIHPMYYDVGRDDLFHNVTGLGVRQYGAMETENRMRCTQVDKANAPDLLFKATTTDAKNQFQLAPLGPYGVVGPGYELSQAPMRGNIQDGMMVMREAGDAVRSNLSEFRQPVTPDRPGNPDTATEARMKASAGGSLTNTVFERYYQQVDWLYERIVRNLFNPNSTDLRARKAIKRAKEMGVPDECFGRIGLVKAVRIIGQGTPWLRQQAISSVGQVIKQCPESGQRQWRHDFITAQVGPSGVHRYDPTPGPSDLPDEQTERAHDQIVGIKVGMPAIVSDSQDAMVFSKEYIKAADGALGSLGKGGEPAEVAQFAELCGKAAAMQIQRMRGDPLRTQEVNMLEQELKKIGSTVDKLKKTLQKQAQQKQKLQQKAQAVQSDAQVKAMKVQGDLKLKAQKQKAALAMQQQKHRQQLAISDATAASQVKLAHYRALNDM